MQSQPNYQHHTGAHNDGCSKNGDGTERHSWTKLLTTVTETGYQDHDMQTDIASEHLEHITTNTPPEI